MPMQRINEEEDVEAAPGIVKIGVVEPCISSPVWDVIMNVNGTIVAFSADGAREIAASIIECAKEADERNGKKEHTNG